jgi:hypothetical protein
MHFLYFDPHSEYKPDPDSATELNMALFEQRTDLFAGPVRRRVVQKLPVIRKMVPYPNQVRYCTYQS